MLEDARGCYTGKYVRTEEGIADMGRKADFKYRKETALRGCLRDVNVGIWSQGIHDEHKHPAT
jgi:hypothetical protein